MLDKMDVRRVLSMSCEDLFDVPLLTNMTNRTPIVRAGEQSFHHEEKWKESEVAWTESFPT